MSAEQQQLEAAWNFYTRKKYQDASGIYQEILSTDPDQTVALLGMGLIAQAVENMDAAKDYFQRSLAGDANQYSVWLKLAEVCSKLRQPDMAIQSLRNAIKLSPQKSPGFLNLGTTLLISGDKEGGLKALEKAFTLDEQSPQAFRILTSNTTLEAASPLIELARSRMADAGTSNTAKANLAYGLAYFYEQQKNHQEFIKHIILANRLQKTDGPDWRPIFGGNADAIKKTFTKATFEKGVADEAKVFTPIFIVGMPRSGTTLTEQIITSHPGVFGADEVDYMTSFIVNGVAVMTKKPYLGGINELTREQLTGLSQNYQARMQKIAPGFGHITDKYLSNYMSIGLIKLILPWAKVINLTRHPMDTAFSIYKNYFIDVLPFCHDLEDMAHFYHIYREMIKFWDDLLPGFICHVRYEDLVGNFESEARRIIDFCGLEWHSACLAPEKNPRTVLTLSQDQVRKPVYKSSVGTWKKYQEELAPFRKILEQYGYEIET